MDIRICSDEESSVISTPVEVTDDDGKVYEATVETRNTSVGGGIQTDREVMWCDEQPPNASDIEAEIIATIEAMV
jgi:hypothetical protein